MNHWMKAFFVAHIALEFQQNEESLASYEDLAKSFPNSNYILAQTAYTYYNLQGFASVSVPFLTIQLRF